MNRYEGSQAVSNARMAIIFLAWIFIILGAIITVVGFTYDYSADWGLIYPGIILIVAGVSSCILNAILKGFEQIVNASEDYMEEIRKNKHNQ